MLRKAKDIFKLDDDRSILARKNMVFSIALKGVNIGINLLLVPMTLHYLNQNDFGIWITLSSIVAWLAYFDIGLGNGLRNNLVECLTKGDYSSAKTFVSTTYALLLIIVVAVFVIALIANPFINWSQVLNVPNGSNIALSKLALVLVGFFCLQFIFRTIGIITIADQKPALNDLINVSSTALSLIVVYFLTKRTAGSLLNLGIAISSAPVLVYFVANVIAFNSPKYKLLSPSIKYIDFSHSKILLGLGLKFFVLQMGALVLFQTDNLVITQLFGPSEVTTFNIAYKLFSIITMLFMIVANPLWSAFTDAYAKNDIDWIKTTIKRMQFIWLFLVVVTGGLILSANLLYEIWLDGSIKVPFSLSLTMGVYVIVYGWQTIYVYFLNGIGKIKFQIILITFSALVNIPIAIYLGHHFGIIGVTLSNIILFVIMGILFFVQSNKIINGTAKGILNT